MCKPARWYVYKFDRWYTESIFNMEYFAVFFLNLSEHSNIFKYETHELNTSHKSAQ